jgi:ABC-2 type transport system permease protein
VSRLWPIVRREYLERVRSKAFLISTLLGPLLMGALTIVPGIMVKRTGKPLRVTVLDATSSLGAAITADLAGRKRDNGTQQFATEPPPEGTFEEVEPKLKARVLKGDLDGYLKLAHDVLETSKADYFGKTVSNFGDLHGMRESTARAVTASRLAGEGVDPARVAALTKSVDLRPVRLTEEGEREDRGAGFMVAFILVVLLYTSVLMWGQAVLTSVLEEKTSRVVEVMAAAVPSTYLLTGKLLGVGAAGLTQFLVWAMALGAVSLYGAGASGAGLPQIAPLTIVFFVLFFVIGYLIYSALFAALGASVNTSQEAQNLVFPAMLPLILCMMFMFPVVTAPDSTLAIVLSLIPFFAPLLMFARMTVLMPPAWQIALSLALCLITLGGILFAAGRIYRVGILMYGKRPTFPEIMKWVGRS